MFAPPWGTTGIVLGAWTVVSYLIARRNKIEATQCLWDCADEAERIVDSDKPTSQKSSEICRILMDNIDTLRKDDQVWRFAQLRFVSIMQTWENDCKSWETLAEDWATRPAEWKTLADNQKAGIARWETLVEELKTELLTSHAEHKQDRRNFRAMYQKLERSWDGLHAENTALMDENEALKDEMKAYKPEQATKSEDLGGEEALQASINELKTKLASKEVELVDLEQACDRDFAITQEARDAQQHAGVKVGVLENPIAEPEAQAADHREPVDSEECADATNSLEDTIEDMVKVLLEDSVTQPPRT